MQSEKQMHNHQQSRAHRKMVEELQAEFGDDVLNGLEEETEEEEEEEEGLEDPDLEGGEAEGEVAAAAEGGHRSHAGRRRAHLPD